MLLPLGSLLLLFGAASIAIVRSERSRIVVYNQTGEPVQVLMVQACGQAALFRDVVDEGSVEWTLDGEGPAGGIELEAEAGARWRWQGGYVEPRSGHRVTLRLWPDGQVEVDSQISVWRRLIGWQPAGDR